LKRKTGILFLAFVLLVGGGCLAFEGLKIEVKARVAQVLLQYAWHKTIKTGEDQRPWRSFDGVPVLRLMIPRHEVDQIVLAGTSGQALSFSTVFHEESRLPGTGGTTVLSAHRDTTGIYIRKLQKGDTIKLQDRFQQWHSYTIEDFDILNVKTDTISTTNAKEVLLIITCYPFNALTSGTPLRYVVSASQNLGNRT
jgi:sortase A